MVTLVLVAGVVSLVVTGTGIAATILRVLIRVFIGIDFLLPFFYTGLLKVATIWDPGGLPAAYPFGNRHYTGQWSVTVDQSNTRTKEQNKQHKNCDMRVQAVARPYVSFSRSSVNRTRHRRAVLATRVEKKQRNESPIVKV